jgi:hypothetical protein
MIERMARRPAVGAEGAVERLTAREREVTELVIEESTGKTHTKRLVGPRDRAQVVLDVYEHGLAGQ